MKAAVDKAWAAAIPTSAARTSRSRPRTTVTHGLDRREGNRARDRAPDGRRGFINRLKRGCGSRPTRPSSTASPGERPLDGGITASQNAAETPYNTYMIDGLPPTPIANPGEAALMAVAHPADSEFLYLVAVTPGKPLGRALFAST